MRDIKWNVGVSYLDLSGSRLFTTYKVNAKDIQSAEDIVKELFTFKFGMQEDIKVVVEPEKLTQKDIGVVSNVISNVKQLNTKFNNMSYGEFLDSYQSFEGFSSNLPSLMDDVYYWFTFFNITMKAVYKVTGECFIDTSEIYYKDEWGKNFLIRNNWKEFYYCV